MDPIWNRLHNTNESRVAQREAIIDVQPTTFPINTQARVIGSSTASYPVVFLMSNIAKTIPELSINPTLTTIGSFWTTGSNQLLRGIGTSDAVDIPHEPHRFKFFNPTSKKVPTGNLVGGPSPNFFTANQEIEISGEYVIGRDSTCSDTFYLQPVDSVAPGTGRTGFLHVRLVASNSQVITLNGNVKSTLSVTSTAPGDTNTPFSIIQSTLAFTGSNSIPRFQILPGAILSAVLSLERMKSKITYTCYLNAQPSGRVTYAETPYYGYMGDSFINAGGIGLSGEVIASGTGFQQLVFTRVTYQDNRCCNVDENYPYPKHLFFTAGAYKNNISADSFDLKAFYNGSSSSSPSKKFVLDVLNNPIILIARTRGCGTTGCNLISTPVDITLSTSGDPTFTASLPYSNSRPPTCDDLNPCMSNSTFCDFPHWRECRLTKRRCWTDIILVLELEVQLFSDVETNFGL